jgi:hypothetical protein
MGHEGLRGAVGRAGIALRGPFHHPITLFILQTRLFDHHVLFFSSLVLASCQLSCLTK